jgi:predicted 3-demethylubiquinone-9 3-methyltransferase (glyoxalase superfamily)
MTDRPKISTCLWFNDNAEEAINFYLSVFPGGEILRLVRNGGHGPGPEGSMLAATIRIEDHEIDVINGGPHYALTPAVSLVVKCATQAQVDTLWDTLGNGGEHQQCGWLNDRFGLCWQIVPTVLFDLLQSPDPAKAGRVMQAMLQMTKFDIAALQRASEGR